MYLDQLFGSLSRDYCIYFYFLSLFAFVLFAVGLIAGIFLGLSKGKKINYYFKLVAMVGVYFIFYFQNRLFYLMCSKSL